MIKKIIKILFLALLIYAIFLIELSFNNSFSVLLILLCLINLLEDPRNKLGLFSAFFVGFFWDIYSSNEIGIMALSLFLIFSLLKIILFKYVRISSISWIPKI